MQTRLPAVESAKRGFRLDRLEMLKWGTFDGNRIHVLPVGGHTVCVTGPNGGGKSTAVDALLTLIHPNRGRNYNVAASGTGKKNERDEKTYILGVWGREAATNTDRGIPKKLRQEGELSVLLAAFRDEDADEWVTLAQLLWVHGEKAHHRFCVVKRNENIRALEIGNMLPRELERKLETRGWRVYDDFTSYEEVFRKALRIRSPKALALFNQTVSIKDVGDVNHFVREHMLEKPDTSTAIEGIRKHYGDLNKCYEAILRIKEQLKILDPLVELAKTYKENVAVAQRCQDLTMVATAYFAKECVRLIQADISVREGVVATLKEKLILQNADEVAAQKRVVDLSVALQKDEIGSQIADLERRIGESESTLRSRKTDSTHFHGLLAKVGRPAEIATRDEHAAVVAWAEAEAEVSKKLGTSLAAERAGVNLKIDTVGTAITELTEEVESLRGRKDKIYPGQRRIRELIAKGTGVPLERLPFVGELVDVREDESEWRGAIDFVMRGYALSMVVPDDGRTYQIVSRFVEDNKLRGRLVYFRVRERAHEGTTLFPSTERITGKIELRPDTPFRGWLAREVNARFNHVCCPTMDRFWGEAAAITKTGHVKQPGERHIKDDTVDVEDPNNHVLGWNNQAKLAAKEKLLSKLEGDVSELTIRRNKLDGDITAASQRHGTLTKIALFGSFDRIDVGSEAETLARMKNDLEVLKTKDKAAAALRQQLEDAKKAHGETKRIVAETQAEIGGQEAEAKRLATRRDTKAKVLATIVGLVPTWEAAAEGLIEFLPKSPFTESQTEDVESATKQAIADRRTACEGKAANARTEIEKAMVRYLGLYSELKRDYEPKVSFLDDFLTHRGTLEKEDLKRHEDDFRELMRTQVSTHLAMFRSGLEGQVRAIEEKIKALNDTLVGIDYTERTYIQLEHTPNPDKEIANFRQKLTQCISGDILSTDADRETAFKKVRDFIAYLDADARITATVSDTRNWLRFAAPELDRQTKVQIQYHSDSAGRSGGQKAKLAFTILASAIAFQYELSGGPDSDSFRLVVIDEMFSKSDDDNSLYALNLFRKFDLQLIIVNPLDGKTRLVEPYVSSYHLITNREERSSTILSLTVEEYRGKRAELEDQAVA